MESLPPSDLLDRLVDGDRELRRSAASALFRRACEDAAVFEGRLDAVRGALEDEADPLVRAHLVASLGMASFWLVEYDQPKSHLDALLERLTDPDPVVRQTVLGVLWNRPDHPLWDSPEIYDDGERIRELAAVGIPECLDDDADVVRRRASDHLAAGLVRDHPEPDSVVAVLLDRIEDHLDVVRRRAADCVVDLAADAPSLIGPHSDELRARLDADDDAVRLRAAAALVALDDAVAESSVDDAVAETLIALLSNRRGQRRRALEELEGLAAQSPALAERVFEVLTASLGTFQTDVRGTAAAGLARLAERYPDHAPAPAATLAAIDAPDPYDERGVYPLALVADEHPRFVGNCLADAARELGRGEDPGLLTGQVVERVGQENPAALEPAADAFRDLLVHEEQDPREAGVKLVSALAVERPSAVEPFVDDFVGVLGDLGAYERRIGTEGLLAIALAGPATLLEHSEFVAELVTSFEDATRRRRHNAAVALARLADDDPTAVPAVGETLLARFREHHHDRCWDYDRLVYVADVNRNEHPDPFPHSVDPAWPLGVVAESHPDLLDDDTLLALADWNPNTNEWRAVSDLIREIGAGDGTVVQPLVDRIVANLENDPDYATAQCLELVASDYPSLVARHADVVASAADDDPTPAAADALEDLLGHVGGQDDHTADRETAPDEEGDEDGDGWLLG